MPACSVRLRRYACLYGGLAEESERGSVFRAVAGARRKPPTRACGSLGAFGDAFGAIHHDGGTHSLLFLRGGVDDNQRQRGLCFRVAAGGMHVR